MPIYENYIPGQYQITLPLGKYKTEVSGSGGQTSVSGIAVLIGGTLVLNAGNGELKTDYFEHLPEHDFNSVITGIEVHY